MIRAKRWSALSKAVSRSEALLNTRRSTILEAIPDERRDGLRTCLQRQEGLDTLQERIGDTDARFHRGTTIHSPRHRRRRSTARGGWLRA